MHACMQQNWAPPLAHAFRDAADAEAALRAMEQRHVNPLAIAAHLGNAQLEAGGEEDALHDVDAQLDEGDALLEAAEHLSADGDEAAQLEAGDLIGLAALEAAALLQAGNEAEQLEAAEQLQAGGDQGLQEEDAAQLLAGGLIGLAALEATALLQAGRRPRPAGGGMPPSWRRGI